MIIDIHTHTFPERIAASTIDKLAQMAHVKPYSDGTNGGLTASMQEAGIDWSVVLPVATNAGQVAKVNDASVALNEAGKENRILSFGCMHPDCENWKEELDRIAAMGLKGIKVHPIYQGVSLDDPRYLRILNRCGELGLAVISHAGLDVGFPGVELCSPAICANALRQAGPVKLILAHMGGWKNWADVEQLLGESTACLDTSFSLGEMVPLEGEAHYSEEELHLMNGEQFMNIIRRFGTNRIYFGTDSPWGGQKETLRMIEDLPLTPEEKAAILGENARTLLGL